jgi:hypothetical protein
MGVGVLSKSNVTSSVVDRLLSACASQFGIGDDLEWGRLHARELRTAAADLQQGISALQHQQRLVLGLIDERGAYTADGSRDAADWAASHLGLSRRTAVDQLDLGRRLAELPAIAEQAATGALSAEQARPAAQLADAGDEATWADEAPTMGVANLQRRAARRRRPSAVDHAAARSARTFDSWVAGQELRFRGSVPIDGGAALLKSIERAMPDRDPESPATLGQRQADGLLALASASITADADPDRATVVLIAELAAVCDDDPAATTELETGEPVATQTARRLVCDGRLSVLVQDRTGRAVGIGTTARTVTPAMRRALVVRDAQCRFGTCTARRFLHAHHIEHWPAPTVMGNLALVCYEHHHALHEGGWHLTGDPFGELVACTPMVAAASRAFRSVTPPSGWGDPEHGVTTEPRHPGHLIRPLPRHRRLRRFRRRHRARPSAGAGHHRTAPQRSIPPQGAQHHPRSTARPSDPGRTVLHSSRWAPLAIRRSRRGRHRQRRPHPAPRRDRPQASHQRHPRRPVDEIVRSPPLARPPEPNRIAL